MKWQQWTLIAGSVALIVLLYFGFETKPPGQKLIEKSRAEGVELYQLENILRETMGSLPADEKRYLQSLENIVQETDSDSVRADALMRVSAEWYRRNAFLLAGYSAERVAEIVASEESWAFAGVTYARVLDGGDKLAHVDLAVAGAIRCFEQAVSLNPDNVEYRIDLAVCFVESPPAENPMKGIQLLLELNRQYPENVSVLYHLARFGIRSGQYANAEKRLATAIELNPEEKRLQCLMAELLRVMRRQEEAEEYAMKCEGRGESGK